MNQRRKLTNRLIGYSLLLSLFLQGCGDFSNSIVSNEGTPSSLILEERGEIQKEEQHGEVGNALPRISFDNERILSILRQISVSPQKKEKALLYLKNIREKIKEIEGFKLEKYPEDFYESMKDAILEIRNTAEELYELTKPSHPTLPNSLKALILKFITPFEKKLHEMMEMSTKERADLVLKTKRLYAEQSYICRQAELQGSLMGHLGKISHLLTEPGKPSPRCYISYAWPSKEKKKQEYWVQPFLSILYDHLTAAGIRMVMDIRDNKVGDSIYNFMEQSHGRNHIILVGTESLLEKHYSITPHAVKTELSIINNRFEQDQKIYGYIRICPLLISGTMQTSFPEIYDKYRTVRDARDKGYVPTLRLLMDWIYKWQINKLETAYINLWHNFDKQFLGLPKEADSQAIEAELQIGYHQKSLDFLREDRQFQAVQAQEEGSPGSLPEKEEKEKEKEREKGADIEVDEPGYVTAVLEGLHKKNFNKKPYYKKGDEDEEREKRKKGIAEQLREWYTSEEKKCISLLIPEKKGPTKQIPIEKLYTCLAIIGETEKKEKKKEIKQSKPGEDVITYGIIPTHESIFEPKEAIELEKLFEHEQLKTATEKRVLVQGSAGIGKTTLCRHIAYRWAQKELFQEFDYLFWLPLRNLNKDRYSKRSYLADYLAQECQLDRELAQSFLNDPSLRKKCLILLDGYDELSSDAEHPSGSLYPIFKELKAFSHLLITTRPQLVDVKTGCQLEILGFDAKGVQEYIDRFFAEEERNHAQEVRQALKQPLIRSLARIPINLEIFCSLAAAGELLAENPTMTALYIQLTDWLFKRFRVYRSSTLKKPSNVAQDPNPRNAKEVKPLAKALEKIAWKAMKQNNLYIPTYQIMEMFRNSDSEMETDNIQKIGPLRIEGKEGVFNHLTFQEFFAAAYLARLYQSNPKAAQKKLEKIKFEPRYQLVLPMTAGYLSDSSKASKKKPLLAFFNDLFSEPFDLAIGYGLRLQARCLEECQDPVTILQYRNFMEQVIRYLKEHPNERLKADLLTGNTHLLSHERVIRFFIDHLQDETQQISALTILRYLAQRGGMFPNPILSTLTTILISSLEKDNKKIKFIAVEILEEIAQNGYPLSQEALSALIAILTDFKADSWLRRSAANALGEVAQYKQPLAQGALSALIALLINPKAGSEDCNSAADALRKVVQGEHPLSHEPLSALIALLNNPQAGYKARKSAVNALGKMVKSGHPLPQEALSALINLLTDSQADSEARSFAAQILGEVAKSEQQLPQEALSGLRAVLTDSQADFWNRKVAVDALGEVAKSGHPLPQEAFLALITLLTDPQADFWNRKVAVDALGEVAKSGHPLPQEALSTLIALLSNPQAGSLARCFAVEVLGKVVQGRQTLPQEAFSGLIALLTDSQAESVARHSAAHALRKLSKKGQPFPQQALSALIALLTDPQADSWYRRSAACVLGKVDKSMQPLPQKALSALIVFLTHFQADSGTRKFAAIALGEAARSGQQLPQEGLSALIVLLTDPQVDWSARESAANALGKVAKSGQQLPQEGLSVLIDLLTDPQVGWSVRESAASALGEVSKSEQLLPQEALWALISVLIDSQAGPEVRRSAANALGKVSKSEQPLPRGVLSALITLLTDSKADAELRHSAAYALGEVAKSGHPLPQEALLALIAFLTYPQTDSYTRHSVADALGKVAKSGQPLPQEALSALNAFLTDPQADSWDPYFAADFLRKVAQSGQPLPQEVLSALITVLTDPQAGSTARKFAVNALGEVAKSRRPLPQEALPALITLLTDPQADAKVRYTSAAALKEVIKSRQPLAQEALSALIAFLTYPQVGYQVQEFAADALVEVAQGEYSFHGRALQKLILPLDNLKDDFTRNSIFRILEEVSVGTCPELSYELFVKLCFVTGHAFFYRDGRFYITKKREIAQVKIEAGIRPEDLYKKIVLEKN